MMFRWINKQPDIQEFLIQDVTIKIPMTEVHHLINPWYFLWFILTLQGGGGGMSNRSLVYFHLCFKMRRTSNIYFFLSVSNSKP